jgi:hypothetical protein
MVSTRTITLALDTFEGRAHVTPISLAEVENALWYLETYVLSARLCYDGTVDQRQVERIEAGSDKVDSPAFALESVRPNEPEEVLADVAEAGAVMAMTLSDDAFRFEAVDRALEDKGAPAPFHRHQKFRESVADLRQRFAGLREEEASAEADAQSSEIRSATEEYYSAGFTGSKCIAAIAAGGPARVRMVEALYRRHEGEAPRVTGALINRFRVPYVGRLSRYARAVHLPDSGLAPLSERNFQLYQQYLAGHLRRGAERAGTDLGEALKANRRLPPIGLYLLLLSRANSPDELLDEAVAFARRYRAVFRFGAEQTREAAATLPWTDDIENELRSYYDQIHHDKTEAGPAIPGGKVVQEFLVPAIRGTTNKVLADALPIAVTWTLGASAAAAAGAPLLVAGVAGGVTSGVIALGQNLWRQRVNSYVDCYRKLDDAFRTTRAVPGIADAVKRVFKRGLVDR